MRATGVSINKKRRKDLPTGDEDMRISNVAVENLGL
jgi:hypothetical protein